MSEHPGKVPRHPIGVVAQRTGLSQDVLRVWERRYGAVHPGRGDGGQRLYGDDDIERLRLLHAATRAGRSISQVVRLTTEELGRLVDEDAAALVQRESRGDVPSGTLDAARAVSGALDMIRSLDSARLDESMRRAAAVLGAPVFLETVAAPLLGLVGDEWHAGRLTPAHEHLASSVLHDVAANMMRTFPQRDGAPRIIVATTAGERHVTGAVLAGATAAVEGWNVIYLGADLPAEDIAAAAIASDAGLVALSVVYVADRDHVLEELRALRARLPARVTVLAGGAGARVLATELSAMGVRVAATLGELSAQMRRDP